MTTESDEAARSWAISLAVGYLNGLPSWRRPSDPMPLAERIYQFVKPVNGKPAVTLSVVPGPGAA